VAEFRELQVFGDAAVTAALGPLLRVAPACLAQLALQTDLAALRYAERLEIFRIGLLLLLIVDAGLRDELGGVKACQLVVVVLSGVALGRTVGVEAQFGGCSITIRVSALPGRLLRLGDVAQQAALPFVLLILYHLQRAAELSRHHLCDMVVRAQ